MFDGLHPARVAARFLLLVEAAETDARHAPRVVGRETLLYKCLRLSFEVIPQLLVELSLDLCAVKQRSQA
jgi:hypothetical protein